MHKYHRSDSDLKCPQCKWHIVALVRSEEADSMEDPTTWKRAKAIWKTSHSFRANQALRMSTLYVRKRADMHLPLARPRLRTLRVAT